MSNKIIQHVDDVTDPVVLCLLEGSAIKVSHGFVVETSVQAIERLFAERDTMARVLERTTRDLGTEHRLRVDATKKLNKIRKLVVPTVEDQIRSINETSAEIDALSAQLRNG